MVVKNGRFGPYVTDGETNASLRKGDEVETLTVDRAAELLADRRLSAPAKPDPPDGPPGAPGNPPPRPARPRPPPPRPRRRPPAKKPAAKKPK